jgi:hypothetical protein
MLIFSLQVLAIATVAIYFILWRAALRRRDGPSWDSLLARLRPDWSARDLSDQFLWKAELNATPEDTWRRIDGLKGLQAMYQNANVMLEIADFAARNNPRIDRRIVESLRNNAAEVRLCAMLGLTQYGLSNSSEGAQISAFKAASSYASMAAQLTHLLQDHAATRLPDFVAAMGM